MRCPSRSRPSAFWSLALPIAFAGGAAAQDAPDVVLIRPSPVPVGSGTLDDPNRNGLLDRACLDAALRDGPDLENWIRPRVDHPGPSLPFESAWPLLTAPETPLRERVSIAHRAALAFPYRELPRLMKTLGELRAEERLHNWGLRPNPTGALMFEDKWWVDVLARIHGWSESERVRTVLGHAWRAPEAIQAWAPKRDDFVEGEAAPWPLQVKIALEVLLHAAAPRMYSGCQGERCEEWLDAALLLPCGTDDEARLFVEAAGTISHHVTERVLARYRTLLVDTRFAQSAESILHLLGELPRLAMCASPETTQDFQVLFLDALEGGLSENAKHRVACHVGKLREMWNGPRRRECATLLLRLSRLGLDPTSGTGSDWSRLYVYLLSACEAMDEPPFPPDRGMGSEIGPGNATLWVARYRDWFDAHRAELERVAELERPALDAARARLVALEPR